MRKHLLLFLVLVVCFMPSCAASKEEKAAAPAAEYNTVATIKDIMDSAVDPSADYIWESVKTEVSATATIERAPRTDEDWKEERRRAILLVEAANLLVMPGRHVAKPGEKAENPQVELGPEEIEASINANRKTFLRLAREFQGTAVDLLHAIEKKDLHALLDLGGDLDTRCENCHKTYWYPNDPAFKNDAKEIDKDK